MLYIWSNYSDLTSKGSWGRETSIFQGNLDWWNIMKYYDLGRYWYIDTAFFPTRLCYAIPYFTLLYYYTRLWYATPCYTTLHYTVLYYTILYCTILSFTLLYYRILYYTVPCHTSQEQYYLILFGTARFFRCTYTKNCVPILDYTRPTRLARKAPRSRIQKPSVSLLSAHGWQQCRSCCKGFLSHSKVERVWSLFFLDRS